MVMLSSASRIVFTGLPPYARRRGGHAQRREQSFGVEQGDRLAADTQEAPHEGAAQAAARVLLFGVRDPVPLLDEIHAPAQEPESGLPPVAHDEAVGVHPHRPRPIRIRPERSENTEGRKTKGGGGAGRGGGGLDARR